MLNLLQKMKYHMESYIEVKKKSFKCGNQGNITEHEGSAGGGGGVCVEGGGGVVVVGAVLL